MNKTKSETLKNEIETKGVEAYDSFGRVVKFLALKEVKTFDMSFVNGGRNSNLYVITSPAGKFEILDDAGRFVAAFPVEA